MKRYLILSLPMSILPLFVFFAGCFETSPADKEEGEQTHNLLRVELSKARPEIFSPSAETPGLIVPEAKTTVSVPLSEKMEKSYTRTGDRVAEGALLARFSTDSIQNEIRRLAARIATKKKELEQRKIISEKTEGEVLTLWHEARRTGLTFLRAREELQSVRENYKSHKEIYQSGGMSRKSLETSKEKVRSAEYNVRKKEILLVSKLNSLHPGNYLTHIEDSFSLEVYFTEEKKRNFIEKEKQRKRTLVSIVEAEIHELEVDLAILKNKVEKASVYAPFPGIVETSYAQEGKFYRKGAALYILYRPENLRIEASLGESNIISVEEGSTVHLTFPSHQDTIESRVSRIIPKINSRNKSFTLFIDLPPLERTAVAGMFIECHVSTGEETPTLAVPLDSLIPPYNTQRAELWVFETTKEGALRGRLSRRKISLHGRDQEHAYIDKGLSPESWVCVEPTSDMYEGIKVKGVKNDTP